MGPTLVTIVLVALVLGGGVAGGFLVRGPWHWLLRLALVVGLTWAMMQATAALSAHWALIHPSFGTADTVSRLLGDAALGALSAVQNTVIMLLAWSAGLAGGIAIALWRRA